MFLYCDLVQNEILGDTQTALLRAIPLSSSVKSNHKNFTELQWRRLIKSSIQSITISLRSETGDLIPFFSRGRTNLTLQFKRSGNWMKTFHFCWSVKSISIHLPLNFFKKTVVFLDAGRTMDQHYDNQMQSKPSANATLFWGPARQYGSGGVGAFVMRKGRVAVPLIKTYLVPVAKEFGRNLMSSFVPEIPKIVAGKARRRKALQESLKKICKQNCKSNHWTAGPAYERRSVGRRNAACGRAIGPGWSYRDSDKVGGKEEKKRHQLKQKRC